MRNSCLVSLGLVACTLAGCTEPLPPRPQHKMTMVRDVPGVRVIVAPAEVSAWIVSVENNRDAPVSLVWDESTFVDSKHRSYGRLLRGQTRIQDVTKPQMNSPIAAGAFISEWCVGESGPANAFVESMDKARNRKVSLPDAVTKGAARLLLTFDGGNGRELWIGELAFEQPGK